MSSLALLGGRKAVTARRRSPAWPHYSVRGIATVAMMLYTARGNAIGHNRVVKEAEAKFADYHGVRYALALSSGTGALHSALAGCGIEPGDEVITSPYSWGATTACILHHGAVPVFADVLPDTGLLDPAAVVGKITARTRAILVVHLYGQPADMPALQAIATKYHLQLIEDASQAHGAKLDGKLVGSLSDAAGFSCMTGKLLAVTEMGMLLTDDRQTYERALLLSQHSSRLIEEPSEHSGGLSAEYLPYADSLSYNYRATGLDCVLLMDQLPHLAGWNRTRSANRNHFVSMIGDIEFIRFPSYPANVEPVYHIATLNYDEKKAMGVTRETFLAAIIAEGVDMLTYVDQPIPLFARLQTQNENLSFAPWLPGLRNAGIRYTANDLPVCLDLTRKRAMQMRFNAFIELEPKLMQQYANAFHKVAENLPLLLERQRAELAAQPAGSVKKSTV